ncbi:MAG: hypothetical protein JW818_00275 [Pirellulales bacterium]|nr:hypothetical protein [Pirellulales bacterium]
MSQPPPADDEASEKTPPGKPQVEGEPEGQQVLRANRKSRVFLLLIALAVMLLAVGLAWQLDRRVTRLRQLAQTDPTGVADRARFLLHLVAWFVGLGQTSIALWLWRLGYRTRRAGQFPPPGSRVTRDTVVRTGRAALRRANLAIALAVVFLLLGLGTVWYLCRLATVLFSP